MIKEALFLGVTIYTITLFLGPAHFPAKIVTHARSKRVVICMIPYMEPKCCYSSTHAYTPTPGFLLCHISRPPALFSQIQIEASLGGKCTWDIHQCWCVCELFAAFIISCIHCNVVQLYIPTYIPIYWFRLRLYLKYNALYYIATT